MAKQYISYRPGSGGGSSSGNVTGPVSSTDTALARWSGTTGSVLLDSNVTLSAPSGGFVTLNGADINSGSNANDLIVRGANNAGAGLGGNLWLLGGNGSSADNVYIGTGYYGTDNTKMFQFNYGPQLLAPLPIARDPVYSFQGGYSTYGMSAGGSSTKIFATGHPFYFNGDGSAQFISGDVQIGAGNIGTSATSGFLYLNAYGSGAPTGTPTNAPGNGLPMYYDKTNNKLWMYNGTAWKSVTLS